MTRNVNLFIIGVQKCGTTSLADLLNSHPEVFIPSIKETYFFCLDENYANGPDWYEQEFYATSKSQAARWRGDATPFYLADRPALERIAEYAADDTRFLVILRDPVKRAISAFQHQQRMGHESLELAEALQAETGRIAEGREAKGRWWRHAYTNVGLYGAQLESALEVIDRKNLMVLRQDELSDTGAVQNKLAAFLELAAPFPDLKESKSNPAAMPRFGLLNTILTRPNPVKSLVRTIVPRELRTKIGMALDRLNSKPVGRIDVDAEVKDQLWQQFDADQKKLNALGFHSHKA